MKKAVLGRGLSALIPMEQLQQIQQTPMQESLQTELVSQIVPSVEQHQAEPQRRYLLSLPLDSLVPNPYQPRIKFDEEKLKELSETIRQTGLIQPIVVRKNAGRYEIVSGERRWHASKMAGLTSVSVLISEFDDRAMLEAALIENIEREDLNPIEIAKAVKSLQDRFNLTQDEIAEKLSRDRSTISNLLRLLSLSDDIQKLLLDGRIEFGHAKVILSIQNEPQRRELALKISEGGWSVRKAEGEARRMLGKESRDSSVGPSENQWEGLEHVFSRHLGTPVRLKIKGKADSYSGTMEIQVHGKGDVDRILAVVRKGAIENRLTGAL